MSEKYDISAIGECLIDMVPAGVNELGVPLFGANPGGAPANVLAMFSRLGGRSAFIGKVGKDSFGDSLIQNLKKSNINTDGVIVDSNYNTTLAFVHLDDKGDRSFSFYRKPAADIMIDTSEVSKEIVSNSKFFHFGSVSLTDEPSRTATLGAVLLAKQSGAIISYDPNYRPLLWSDKEFAVKEMKNAALFADIIKVSDEELELITGETDYLKGAQKLADMGISLVFVTLGAGGAFYYNKNSNGLIKTYDVKTVDTTGAGDTFLASVLWKIKGLNKEEIGKLSSKELEEMIKFGNAAGSLVTTKKGAISAMPEFDDIIKLIEEGNVL